MVEALSDGRTKSQPERGEGGERGAAERDASMIGRKVDNIQGSSSSICKVRKICFRREYASGG